METHVVPHACRDGSAPIEPAPLALHGGASRSAARPLCRPAATLRGCLIEAASRPGVDTVQPIADIAARVRVPRAALAGWALAVCAAWPVAADAAVTLPNLPSLPSLPSLPNPFAKKPAAPPPVPAAAAAADDGSLMVTRSDAALLALFTKGSVSGTELAEELKAMRALMRAKRSPAATGAFLGTADPAAAADAGFDPKALLVKQGLNYVEGKLKPYAASVGLSDLDRHMGAMIDDPKKLAQEKIELPSPQGLTPRQMQRIATMAAIVVATRITGQVLKKAKSEFANIETDYLKLLDRREKTASLLYGVLLGGAAGATELDGLYAAGDLKFLRDNVTRMSVKEFANDMGAQNLAMRFLQKSDPAAYADYKARSDGTLSSTRGYIGATAGGAAFAGLLVAFVQQSMAMFRDKQGMEMLSAFPVALLFLKELPPVVEAAWAAGAAGIVEVPMKSGKRFRVFAAEGAKPLELNQSAEVFAAMKKHGEAEPIFTEALFRNGGDGLLYKLYRCDRAEAGRMLDTAVPLEERDKFASGYIAKDVERYSFVNAFTAPGENTREQELGDELLRDDQRKVARRRELGLMQRTVSEGYGRWHNEQLLRMIFANREGGAAQATLQLGDLRIRPVPSAQSLYAYESLIDGCGQQFGGGAAADKPASKPAPSAGAANPKPP
jgi:hypothetical protein